MRVLLSILLSLLLSVASVCEAQNFSHWRNVYWQRESSLLNAQAQAKTSAHIYQGSSRWLNDGAQLSVSQLRQNNASRLYEQQWQLTLPALFTSAAARNANAADADLTQMQLQWQQLNASVQLFSAIAELQIQQKIVLTQAERERTALQLQRDITQRVQAGEAAPDELTQINIETSLAQTELAQAQAHEQALQLQLQLMLGENIEVNSISLPSTSAAAGEHPLIQIATAQARKTQAQRDWSQDWSRDLEWSLLYKRERSEINSTSENSSGIALSIPLGRSGDRRAEQQQAATAAQLAQQQLSLLQQQLPLQQQRADLRLRSAQAQAQQLLQITQWQTQHLNAVTRAWRQGENSFAEVLRAQQKHWQSELDHWQAQQTIFSAQAEWFVAFGVLP